MGKSIALLKMPPLEVHHEIAITLRQDMGIKVIDVYFILVNVSKI